MPALRLMAVVIALALAVGCGGSSPDGADAAQPAADARGIDAAAVDAAREDAPSAAADARMGCLPNGGASVVGTVDGVGIEPIGRVSQSLSAEGLAVVMIRESAGAACPVGPATTERFLTVGLSCPPIEAATYPIASSAPSSVCPPEGDLALFLVQQDGGAVIAVATSGEVVIEAVDEQCVTGTFDVGFESGDTMSGSFGAVVCF